MNSIVYYEIQSSDPKREIEFYKNVFGWKFIREEKIPIEYYRIETSGINGALLKRPVNVPPPECGTNAFCCSLEVESFDKTAEIILKNGGKVALPKFAVPGKCWQGYFLDADNNVFGVFEVDASAR
ncbi:MAG TPA: VOC family protein [Bacteroidia bacterium]|jgi:predicted enzyme related to lactoylglutathione lyase|nr:VOC family protein [Bacteroidia bacterium]